MISLKTLDLKKKKTKMGKFTSFSTASPAFPHPPLQDQWQQTKNTEIFYDWLGQLNFCLL